MRSERERATIDVEVVARILGISRATAYKAVERGEIPSVRFGGRIVVPRAALERLLACGHKAAAPQSGEPTHAG